MHLEIYKLAISFREEFMASKNLIGEKFMIPCKNIHPCMHGHTTSIAWRVECVAHAAPGELIASKSLVDAFLLLSLFGLKTHIPLLLCYTHTAIFAILTTHTKSPLPLIYLSSTTISNRQKYFNTRITSILLSILFKIEIKKACCVQC